jgi:hypothetical protein
VQSKLEFRQKKSGNGKKVDGVNHAFGETKTVLWGDAMVWMKESYSLIPDPQGVKDAVYIPLLERAKGTSYEEKVAALQNSSKRRQKYEDNVIKKRKTKEEDNAFYDHMAKQGGSGI